MLSGPGYAITCLGALNCLGPTLEQGLVRAMDTSSGLRQVLAFPDRAPQPRQRFLGVAAFDHDWSGNRAGNYRPRQSLLAETSLQPIQDSVREICRRYGPDRVAVVLGTSTGGIEASERAVAEWLATARLPSDYSMEEQHAAHAVLDDVRRRVGAEGPAFVVSTACSSSAKALAAAGRLLNGDFADAALVIGVDSLCLTTLLGFDSLGVVNDSSCKPFANDTHGLNIGEGAAFLMIEKEGLADAYLLSAGETHDAHHMAHPHPEAEGAERAMRDALKHAGVEALEIDYVNAHGTGTAANDRTERAALARTFGTRTLVSSTKGLTGHLLGASGLTEAILCHAAIAQQRVPGNGPWATQAATDLHIPQTSTSTRVDLVLSNSFAFGGSNASILLASRRGRTRLSPTSARDTAYHFELAQLTQLTQRSDVSENHQRSLLSERALGRASLLTRLFTELLTRLVEGGFDASRSPTVFGSAHGEMETALHLMEMQARSGTSSPLRFQVSVHNAAQGLLSIATKNRGFATCIAAGSNTFAMSLLEAISFLKESGQREIAVLVADEGAPSALTARAYEPVAVGVHLRRAQAGTSGMFISAPQRRVDSQLNWLSPPPLDPRTRLNPIADALQLAWAFQQRAAGRLGLGDSARLTKPAEDCWSIDLTARLK